MPTLQQKRLLLSGGAPPLVFLLRDDFTTDQAAPLTSPRTAEPGPGTLNLVQNDGQFRISGNRLTITAQATAVWGDLSIAGVARARVVGRALLVLRNINSANTYSWVGWNNDSSPGDTGATGLNAIRFDNGALLQVVVEGSMILVGAFAATTDYLLAIVYRTMGAFYFIQGGVFPSWTLLHVSVTGTSTPGYPAASFYNAAGTIDTLRVLDLPAPFTDDFGLASQRLAGARAAGDTLTHEANHLGEATLTTRPSAGQVEMRFRVQDANNYWQWTIDSAGALDLDEVVAGVVTQRATSAAGALSGHRVVWIADGSTIRLYTNNVLRITYASASNFATATAGQLVGLGTGGAVSDIVAFPRTLTGTASVLLDAAVG